MDIKEVKSYTISITNEEKDTLLKDIKKLNDGEAGLDELNILTDIYGFLTNN